MAALRGDDPVSAGRAERAEVLALREDRDARARDRGHLLRWRLGPTALRRGCAYLWDGRCEHCGAEVTVGRSWSSCSGVRDARRVACSGPGTAVLTEIETDQALSRCGEAIADYLAVVGPLVVDPTSAEIVADLDTPGEREP